MISKVLAIGRPTMIFSAPYASHEWHELSDLRRQKLGENMVSMMRRARTLDTRGHVGRM